MKNRNVLLFLGAVIITASVAIYFGIYFTASSSNFVDIEIGGTVIRAEIVDTIPTRIQGLMFRDTLPENQGMLFVFESEGKHWFWMRNMKFPIDIIWLDMNNRVVDIVKNAEPCHLTCPRYTPQENAKFVLEIRANLTDQLSVEKGSLINFKIND